MIDLGLDLYRTIGQEADRMGIEAYAVGGVVRDFFLQRPCTDIDIVCVGNDQKHCVERMEFHKRSYCIADTDR